MNNARVLLWLIFVMYTHIYHHNTEYYINAMYIMRQILPFIIQKVVNRILSKAVIIFNSRVKFVATTFDGLQVN